MRLVASLSLAKADSHDDNEQDAIARSVPKRTAGLLGIFRIGDGSFVSFDYNQVKNMEWADKRPRDRATIDRLDFQFLRNFRLRGQRASLALNFENVLGKYTEYDEDNTVSPGGYARFSISYH